MVWTCKMTTCFGTTQQRSTAIFIRVTVGDPLLKFELSYYSITWPFLIHSLQTETKICMHQHVPYFALYPNSQFLYYNAILSSQLNHRKGAQIFRKSMSHMKIVGV
jgi:hypothetical protein